MPLLTIVIPTFNRAPYLVRQLDALLPQLHQTADVELLVVDNHSTDETASVLSRYVRLNRQLRCYRQPANVGLFGNVLTGYRIAAGKYIWFLSDDDLVLPDALKTILETLIQVQPTVLTFAPAQESSADCQPPLSGPPAPVRFCSWGTLGADRAFAGTILLSTLLIQRGIFPEDLLLSLKPTVYPHVTLSLLTLHERFELCSVSIPIVQRKQGHSAHNLFQLYCLDLPVAIRQARWPAAVAALQRHIDRTLREFARLQLAERAGLFCSREGLPLRTWLAGVREHGRSAKNVPWLILILATSRLPRTLATSLLLGHYAYRYRSLRQARLTYAQRTSWKFEPHSSDL